MAGVAGPSAPPLQVECEPSSDSTRVPVEDYMQATTSALNEPTCYEVELRHQLLDGKVLGNSASYSDRNVGITLARNLSALSSTCYHDVPAVWIQKLLLPAVFLT